MMLLLLLLMMMMMMSHHPSETLPLRLLPLLEMRSWPTPVLISGLPKFVFVKTKPCSAQRKVVPGCCRGCSTERLVAAAWELGSTEKRSWIDEFEESFCVQQRSSGN